MTYVEMGKLKWPEAAEFGRDGQAVGLIPLGAFEQHGPHLPLCTDTFITERLARAVGLESALPILVSPVISTGLSEHHTAFPGTVSVENATYHGLVRAYIAAFERMGIRKVAVFSHHGGNFGFMGEVSRARPGGRADLKVIAYDDLQRYLAVEYEGASRAGAQVADGDAHAGLIETSLILYLSDDMCAPDFGRVDGYVATEPDWLQRVMTGGVGAVSANGVLGTPAGATSDIGEAIFQALCVELRSWIDDAFAIEEVMCEDEGSRALGD